MLHCIFLTEVFMAQCRLNAWAHWGNMGPMLIYVCCVQHAFLCLNTHVVGSTNTINICLFFMTIYLFITVSGCVGRVPSALFYPGAYNVVKTAVRGYLCYLLFSLHY